MRMLEERLSEKSMRSLPSLHTRQTRKRATAAALKAVAGEPYYDERTKRTISGGWFDLLPRLPSGQPGLVKLQAARDDYLRSTLATDVPGYDPADDPIAAYLAERDAGGPA